MNLQGLDHVWRKSEPPSNGLSMEEPCIEHGKSLVLALGKQEVAGVLIPVLKVVGHRRMSPLLDGFEPIVPPAQVGRTRSEGEDVRILLPKPFPRPGIVSSSQGKRVSKGAEVVEVDSLLVPLGPQELRCCPVDLDIQVPFLLEWHAGVNARPRVGNHDECGHKKSSGDVSQLDPLTKGHPATAPCRRDGSPNLGEAQPFHDENRHPG